MKPIEGEPAFPNGPHDGFPACYGLSERRYYIGQALAGFCANPDFTNTPYDNIAEAALAQVDALMQSLYPQTQGENNEEQI